MNEKSPDFTVEIQAACPAKPPRRKLYRSSLGVFYTVVHILGQLTALGLSGWALYCYIENENDEHYVLGHLRWLTGLPENGILPQSEEQSNFIFAAMACFALASFLQLTVVWRAYSSPRFLAKNPSLSNFWPMAVSFLLRVASEVLYQCTDTPRHYYTSILWISLSLAYCVLVVDGYWFDDDDPPKMVQSGFRLKPWYVEQLKLPL